MEGDVGPGFVDVCVVEYFGAVDDELRGVAAFNGLGGGMDVVDFRDGVFGGGGGAGGEEGEEEKEESRESRVPGPGSKDGG